MCGPTAASAVLYKKNSTSSTLTDDSSSVPPEDNNGVLLYDDGPIQYTDEELDAMRQVKELLHSHNEKHDLDGKSSTMIDYERVGLKYIAMTTIISKNRPDEAFDKIKKFLLALIQVELTADAVSDEELSGDDDCMQELKGYFIPYHTCGVDEFGRDSMWIRGNDRVYITLEEQQKNVKAGILYHMAIHSNPNTLRYGLANFVIDITDKPTTTSSSAASAAESKLQKINQSFPLRPQAILIVGATGLKRMVVNALIKVASIFTKIKILQRIKFTSVEEAIELFPNDTQPLHYGGKGLNGITQEDIPMWVKERIESFPIPEL